MGSGRHASNTSGEIIGFTDMDEWGNVIEKTVPTVGVKQADILNNFTNHEFDDVLGVYYAKARFYDPVYRRFLAVDPVKGSTLDPQTLNQYSYTLNNPIIFIDPTGLVGQSIHDFFYNLGYIYNMYDEDNFAVFYMLDGKGNKTYAYWGGPGEDLINFVADYEQFYEMPYRGLDSQNRTVGYGHVITAADGTKYDNGIIKDEALALLKLDLGQATGYLHDFLKTNPHVLLNQHQFDALISFTFNAGESWIYNPNTADLRNLLIKGDLSAKSICDELMMWVHVNGQKSAGLYRRRNDEVRIFSYGLYNRTYPKAPQGYV